MAGSVEDRLAIRELVETYSDAVARRDAALWESTWAKDAHWELPGVEKNGRDDIVALWKEAMSAYSLVIQYLTCGGLKIDGSKASGVWYLLEAPTKADGTELFVSGRYDDTYAKGTDGQWLITSRKYTVQQVRGGNL